MATVQIGMRIDPELLKDVDAVAERMGLSRTEVLERCIRLGLDVTGDLEHANPAALALMNLYLQPGFEDVMNKFASVFGYRIDPTKKRIVQDLVAVRNADRADKALKRKGGLSHA